MTAVAAKPEGLLIDLAGVLHVNDRALPGAAETLARLAAAGVPHAFVTNTTRQTRTAIAAQLAGLGLPVPESRIVSAVDATHDWLAVRRLRPHLLVHPAVVEAFADLEQESPDVVVLGDAADGFHYENLNHALQLLLGGAQLVAMADNRYFRDGERLALDIGPFRAALEYASGVCATIIGKPAQAMFETGCARLGLPPQRVAMIGDDAEADVAAALAAGLGAAVLVRTGKYRDGDERKCPRAGLADDFAAAVEMLLD